MDIFRLKVGDFFFDDDGKKWTVISTPEDIIPDNANNVPAHHVLVIPADLNKESYAVYALGNIRKEEAIQQVSSDRFNTDFYGSFANRSMLKDAEKTLVKLGIATQP